MSQAPSSLPAWRVVPFLMAFAALCHFNRISMSVAGTERIMKDYHIEETTMGVVYTAYLIVYTLMMVPGGVLIDRAGPWRALLCMGAGAAIGVALSGAVGLWVSAALFLPALFVVRGLTGAANSPLHPGAARTVSLYVSPLYRSVANGLVTGAAVTGIALTYGIFGFLLDRVGWQGGLLLSGAATAALTLLWWLYGPRPTTPAASSPEASGAGVSGRPDDQSASGEAGLRFRVANPGPAASPPGWSALLTDANLVLLTLSYAAAGYVQYLFFYWNQYYFKDVLQLGTETSRAYSTISSFAMAAGMVAGGWLADRSVARFGARLGHAALPVAGLLLAAVMVMLGAQTRNPEQVLLYFSLSMAALGATEGPFWTSAIALGGRQGGASGAIFNTGGNLGGLMAPVVTPFVGKWIGWERSILLAGIISLIGASFWAWIHIPAARPEEAPGS